MAESNAVPGFLPSVNGLHFPNSWPHVPDFVVDLGPFGKVPIGDASNGLCGGMVYTVVDVFRAELPPIADVSNPSAGSPLFKYLAARLLDSFDVPAGVTKYYQWMTTSDGDTKFWFVPRRGIAWRTVKDEWPAIKADIDAGRPAPLGLVTVHAADPTALGHNHQVLAYAYDVDDAHRLRLRLYDPNTRQPGADDVALSLDLSQPTRATPITHNVNISRPIRGFFRTKYTYHDPHAVVGTAAGG
jgi:hypothetical protein